MTLWITVSWTYLLPIFLGCPLPSTLVSPLLLLPMAVCSTLSFSIIIFSYPSEWVSPLNHDEHRWWKRCRYRWNPLLETEEMDEKRVIWVDIVGKWEVWVRISGSLTGRMWVPRKSLLRDNLSWTFSHPASPLLPPSHTPRSGWASLVSEVDLVDGGSSDDVRREAWGEEPCHRDELFSHPTSHPCSTRSTSRRSVSLRSYEMNEW